MSSRTSSEKRPILRSLLRFRASRRELEERVELLEREEKSRELEGRLESLEGQLELLGKRVQEDPITRRHHELARMDRRWRRHLLEGVRGVVPYMAVNVDGTLYFFATSDPKSGQTLFVETSVRRDQAQLRLALHALDDIGASAVRDVFLDVGAHIGTTTLFAVRHLDFAEAVAVEPSVDNMLLLRLNVLANGLEGVVQTVRAAASNQNGLLDLDVGGLGSEYHHLASGDGTAELRQLVPTTTLDALAARGVFEPDRVGLLWMDIEGHEVHALEGASALLERRVPLVVEFCREKLERAGTLGRVPELLSAHYSRILDLREPAEQSQFLPVQEIGRVIDAHYGHRRGRCVDVLVC